MVHIKHWYEKDERFFKVLSIAENIRTEDGNQIDISESRVNNIGLILRLFCFRWPLISFHIAAFCGESFFRAINRTSKLSNSILPQSGGLHNLWDSPGVFPMEDFCKNYLYQRDSL